MYNFKKKILISLLLVLITLLVGFVANFYQYMNSHIKKDTLEKVASLKKLFNSQLDEDAQALRGVLDIILFNEQIKTALKNKDKSALLDLAIPFFDKLKTNHRVTHFYFTGPDRINILRVHKPEKFGDRIDRHTTIKAKSNREIYNGIELGPLGTFTLRVVAPWYENGQLIGFVELGEEIEHITHQLKTIMDVELFILIEKKFLNRKNWESGMRMLNKTAAWDQFQSYAMIDQTNPHFPEDLTHLFSGAGSPALISNIELVSGDENYSAGFIPLVEANGQQVGFMAMTYRITSMISDVRSTLHGITAIYFLIGGGLFILFFIFLSKIEQQMNMASQALVINEKQLSRAQRIANVGHWSWDIKNGSLGWSDEIYRIFGLQPQEFGATYEAFLEAVHPDDRDAVTQAVDRAVNDRQPYSIEHRIKRKSGEIRMVQEVGEVTRSEDGEPLSMVGTVQDITERKYAETELKESENKYRALIETTGTGYLITDETGKVIDANAEYVRLSGHQTVKEIIGRNIIEWTAPRDLEKNTIKIKECLEKGFVKNLQIDYTDNTGRLTPIEINATVVIMDDHLRILSLCRDITDRSVKIKLQETQLHLIEFAFGHSTKELLQEFLNKAEILTQSQIGFFHFVEEDQVTLTLQAWSTNTLKNMCTAEGEGMHYPMSDAGVWADAAHKQIPVIHNDYESLFHKKGLPEGHAPILRELVTPIMRGGKVKAIMGVGNKSSDYDDHDVEILQQFADFAWETIVSKRAEEALKQYQEHLEELVEEKSASIKAIVETAPDGIVTIDADGAVMTFNAAAEKIFGYSAQEIIGCNFSMLAAPSYMEKNIAQINTYLETGKGYKPGKNIEAEGRTKNGKIFPILMAVSEMVIAGEKHFTGIIRDITDIKETQNELVAAKEAAEKASRAKSVFLANMSHEIRTPMNGILGMTNLALKTALDEKQHNYIAKASDSAQRLLRILNDILDFSKMEADKMEMETADFHLTDVFNNLLNVIQLKADEKNIDLTISLKPEVPRALIGDPLRLGQVLINLGGNAIKFSDPGGTVSFKVNLLEKTSQAVILKFSVTDTGIGMSHDQMDKLFLPFSQADSTINRKYGGTGLGLIISQKIIHLMGGKIWVESQEGSGSTFHFTICLGEQDTHLKQPDTSDSLTQKTVNQALADISGCQILLVEDNEINQELVFELLTSNNMMVETAGNGMEALSLLETTPFDAVLMDLQMPVMDGYEATRKIRKQDKFKDLPIIALTANAMAGDREKALAAGMNDHIAKPLNPDEMYVILSKWIQQNDQ